MTVLNSENENNVIKSTFTYLEHLKDVIQFRSVYNIWLVHFDVYLYFFPFQYVA